MVSSELVLKHRPTDITTSRNALAALAQRWCRSTVHTFTRTEETDMTIAYANALPEPPQPDRLPSRLVQLIKVSMARAREALLIERDIANVRAMNDHILRDIGLNRAEIAHALRTGRRPDR